MCGSAAPGQQRVTACLKFKGNCGLMSVCWSGQGPFEAGREMVGPSSREKEFIMKFLTGRGVKEQLGMAAGLDPCSVLTLLYCWHGMCMCLDFALV